MKKGEIISTVPAAGQWKKKTENETEKPLGFEAPTLETERNGGGSSCRAARVMNPGRALSSTEQQFAGEVLQLTLPKWAEQMTRQLPIVSFSFYF